MKSIISLPIKVLKDKYFIGKLSSEFNIEKILGDASIRHISIDNGIVSVIGLHGDCEKYFTEVSTGWRAIRIEEDLDFSLSGILVSILTPIADVGASVLVASTFDTDLIFIKDSDLDLSVDKLAKSGHKIVYQGDNN